MIVVNWPTPRNDFESSLIAALDEVIAQLPQDRQVGEVAIFFEIPDGWLECDGTTFSQSQHPELYRVLGGGTLPSYTSPFAGTLVAIRA